MMQLMKIMSRILPSELKDNVYCLGSYFRQSASPHYTLDHILSFIITASLLVV